MAAEQLLCAQNRGHEGLKRCFPRGGSRQVDLGGPSQQAVEVLVDLLSGLAFRNRGLIGGHDGCRTRIRAQTAGLPLGKRSGQKYMAKPCWTMAATLEMNQ